MLKPMYLPHSPTMYQHVPSSPKCIDVIGVPPVTVEFPIREMQQLPHQIEKGVKYQVEETKPHQMIWYLKQGFDMDKCICKIYRIVKVKQY